MTKSTTSKYVRPSRSKAAIAELAAQAAATIDAVELVPGKAVEVKAPKAAKAKKSEDGVAIQEAINNAVASLQADIAAKDKAISKLKVESAALKLEITGLETRYASAQALIEDTTASANRLAARATDAEGKVKGLEAALEESRDGVTLFSNKAKALQSELAKANGSCSEMFLKLADANRDIAKLKGSYDSTLANANRLGQRASEAEAELELAQKDVTAKNARIEDLEGYLDIAEDQNVRLVAEITALRSRGLFARLFNR